MSWPYEIITGTFAANSRLLELGNQQAMARALPVGYRCIRSIICISLDNIFRVEHQVEGLRGAVGDVLRGDKKGVLLEPYSVPQLYHM
ncbi:MAG TPA: hypothetical protein ENI27_08035 [bacterium]|nr:hypothetical protein [bacterium]